MMRRRHFILPLALTAVGALAYQSSFLVFSPASPADAVTRAIAVKNTDSISISGANVVVTPLGQAQSQLPISAVTDMRIQEREDVIAIDMDAATVFNPLAFEGVTVEMADKAVTVTSESAQDLSLSVRGSGKSVKIYSAAAVDIVLDNATLSNDAGAALNVQSKKACKITLLGANTLADGIPYATPDGEKENGTLFSLGKMTLQGTGSLTVAALNKHAISAKSLTVKSGDIAVSSSASDGLHADGIVLSGGSFTCAAVTGDGVDAGSGTLDIDGAKVNVTSTADDVKALKADGDIFVRSGEVVFSVAGAQSKGFKTKANMYVEGGVLRATMTGGVVVTNGDPSYCTAFKTDSAFVMSGGELHVTSTGEAGKGISTDGDFTITDGIVDITTSGNGATYVDSLGVTDSYSATCITVDGNAYVYGGKLTLRSSGTAGKALKSDLAMVIGKAGEAGPYIDAMTTGAKFLVSNGTGGGVTPRTPAGAPGGGGFPGGGPGGGHGGMDNADYANPKVIKAEGNMDIYSGTLIIASTQDGGEGLESKATMTINGGKIKINTVDDGINAKAHLQINGGDIQIVATGNDAIDSNGTLTITGGNVLACGTRQPEESFDCDQNTFIITGGNLLGISGGGNSTPSTGTTQKYATPSCSVATGARITITDNSGNVIMSAPNLSNVSSPRLFVSSSKMTVGTYKVMSGGTVTGGVANHDMTVGGTLSGASQNTTFTAR